MKTAALCLAITLLAGTNILQSDSPSCGVRCMPSPQSIETTAPKATRRAGWQIAVALRESRLQKAGNERRRRESPPIASLSGDPGVGLPNAKVPGRT
jgi:hypothetical protein